MFTTNTKDKKHMQKIFKYSKVHTLLLFRQLFIKELLVCLIDELLTPFELLREESSANWCTFSFLFYHSYVSCLII